MGGSPRARSSSRITSFSCLRAGTSSPRCSTACAIRALVSVLDMVRIVSSCVPEPRELLVTLNHALLDRVVVGPVVDDVPGPVGDRLRGVRRGVVAKAVDELELEPLDLLGGVAGRQL